MQFGGGPHRKKELAAFYTPKGLTDIICEWAIKSADCSILEPSFGGCGFLRSARDRLQFLGSQAPAKQIYGCDIDPAAFGHLGRLFETPVDLDHFHEGDFLEGNYPEHWDGKFELVIGNPPYLPYRKISHSIREKVLPSLAANGLKLERRASLWAYFVAISTLLTRTNGRMAWVLPSSFLHANYSKNLRSFILKHFDRVMAFELQERQFLLEGTEEKSIVLLAEGKFASRDQSALSDIPLARCVGVKDLARNIQDWESGTLQVHSLCGTSVLGALTKGPLDIFNQLESDPSCSLLGDLLQVRIGLVTGNNKYFLIDDETRKSIGIPARELSRILPRFQFAEGLHFDLQDYQKLLDINGKGYLVSADPSKKMSEEMEKYLLSYPESQKATCSTFKKRPIWCLIEDSRKPDAFFPVMQHRGPRLVLNPSALNCTNSVHRAYFLGKPDRITKKLISISLLSTFSQISAEISGRSYGSGALKHEPREAEKIKVLLPKIHPQKINSAYFKADAFLRRGNFDEASQLADTLILTALGLDRVPTQVSILRSGLDELRSKRHR